PGLLIADEGGAHLDRAARARVMRALRCELERGLALLWVSQAEDEIAAADRVVPLEGTPGLAAADPGLPPPAPHASAALRIAVAPWDGREGPRVRCERPLEIEVPERGVT